MGDRRREWPDLAAADVIEFVSRYGLRCSPGTAQVVASSLRCFLRFVRLCGLIEVDLAQATPRVANWRLGSLPSTLTEEQLRRLLKAGDRRVPIGKRDYAVLLCMIDLGLRAQEVAGLQLNDIDWRQSTLRINRPKQRRSRLIPMSHRLAQAVASYLRNGRPDSIDRHLFVHHRAPVGVALHPRASVRLPGGLQRARGWTQSGSVRTVCATLPPAAC
jgi:integrase/recombinase XerD